MDLKKGTVPSLGSGASHHMFRLATFTITCVLLGGCFARGPVGDDSAGQKLQVRLSPLVVAINAYQQRYGAAPTDLKLLVPEFLPNLPPDDPSSGVAYHLDPVRGIFTFQYTLSWPHSGRGSCSTPIKHVKWMCVGFI